MLKQVGDFFQILWPSQKTSTLTLHTTQFVHIRRTTHFVRVRCILCIYDVFCAYTKHFVRIRRILCVNYKAFFVCILLYSTLTSNSQSTAQILIVQWSNFFCVLQTRSTNRRCIIPQWFWFK